MKCIIVEDEPFALELTRSYVLKTPFLSLQESFSNPFKALAFLMENEVDLIFLDINMPDLSGIELLNSLPTSPMVIFTTAYAEFGAESYNYNAVDYLLKPITYSRFLKAVNKGVELMNGKIRDKSVLPDPAEPNAPEDYLLLKSGSKLHKVKTESVLYIEGAGNYMAFYLSDGKKILSLLNMAELMKILPDEHFVRIHKSYVVAVDRLDVIERHQVTIKGISIPIGLTFREHFLEKTRGN